MKNIMIKVAIAAFSFASCNSGSNTSTSENAKNNDTAQITHQGVDTETKSAEAPGAGTKASASIKEILGGYLQLKNALAKDNGKEAATAGNAIVTELAKVDMKNLSKEQMKSYMDLADDLKENAEHIGANAGKIEHQREHFEMLSKDIVDLIKTFGNGGQTLYKDYCPIYNDGKGAIWISETKEIKNPYLGSKMPTCGSVKETMK